MGKCPLNIVTAVFNESVRLEKTIENVLLNLEEDDKYIIIDGASTDGTLEVIKEYAARDVRIRWISEPDEGIYDAMNKGWSLAQPDSRILFLGAGDLLLSLPAEDLDADPAAIIYGDVESGQRCFRSNVGPCLKYSNTLHHQAMLVPKMLHCPPPFDSRFKIYADFDYNQRLYRRGASFVYKESLKSYFDPDGVSARKDRYELFRVIKKNFGLWTALLAIVSTPFRQRCWNDKN